MIWNPIFLNIPSITVENINHRSEIVIKYFYANALKTEPTKDVNRPDDTSLVVVIWSQGKRSCRTYINTFTLVCRGKPLSCPY